MCSKVFCATRVLTSALINTSTPQIPSCAAQYLLPGGRFRLSGLHALKQLRLCSQSLANKAAEQDVAVSAAESQTEVAETEESSEPDKLYKTIELEVRGHDTAVLSSYRWYAMETAKLLDITVSRTWQPKKVNERWTLLKAPFGKKKHMVQYEMRTYFEVIELKHLTGSTADTYLEYIQRNLPEGVAMKVTKTSLERLPNYLKPPVESKQAAEPPS
uniref:Small ribosomal subunit protein uS10m n=1 Tax=Amblyomma maculatum TaxID=34609 RepID=G3MSG5_AMBMU